MTLLPNQYKITKIYNVGKALLISVTNFDMSDNEAIVFDCLIDIVHLLMDVMFECMHKELGK